MNEKQEQNEKRKFPGLIYSFAGKVERYTKLIADAVALAEGIEDEGSKRYLIGWASCLCSELSCIMNEKHIGMIDKKNPTDKQEENSDV